MLSALQIVHFQLEGLFQGGGGLKAWLIFVGRNCKLTCDGVNMLEPGKPK